MKENKNQLRKVIFIIDTIQGSGAERSLVEIAKHFKFYTPVFVHIYKGDMLKPELELSGISVYSLNIEKKYGFKEAVEKLIPIYYKEKPALVHSTLYRADIVARKLKNKFPEIPLIGSFVNNSYTPLRYKNKNLLMKFKLWLAYQQDYHTAKKVNFFISNSETIKKSEGEALNVPDEKIKVIYRGRDPKRFENITIQESDNLRKTLDILGEKVLVNVSRLIERKGQLDIIKIMPGILIEHPNTVLLIAGHGSFRENLENEITTLGLEKNVKLLGRFSQIPELLSIADVFLYPSYAEGLPGALIEAMMSSCIIVNSNISENLECVDETNSLTYPVGNLEMLETHILDVLNNPEEYKKLGIKAKHTAKEKFSITHIALEYENTYNNILKNFNV